MELKIIHAALAPRAHTCIVDVLATRSACVYVVVKTTPFMTFSIVTQ